LQEYGALSFVAVISVTEQNSWGGLEPRAVSHRAEPAGLLIVVTTQGLERF